MTQPNEAFAISLCTLRLEENIKLHNILNNSNIKIVLT